jgi:hypothetical protein
VQGVNFPLNVFLKVQFPLNKGVDETKTKINLASFSIQTGSGCSTSKGVLTPDRARRPG